MSVKSTPGNVEARSGLDRAGTTTVLDRVAGVVEARGGEPALRWRSQDGWASLTWGAYVAQARAVAGGLRLLGVSPGDRVALLLRNRPEMHVADLAAMLVGAVPVSLYTTSPPERLRFLLAHSAAKVAVADNEALVARLATVRDRLAALHDVVVVDGDAEGAMPFRSLAVAPPVDLGESIRRARPDDVATIIYTSGTTGVPKGVLITHRNVTAAVDGLLAALGHGISGRRMVSFLPMAHIAERVANHYVHLSEGTDLTTCPEAGRIAGYLPEVRPEIFFAVPRVWEKAVQAVRSLAATAPDGGRAFEAALAAGLEVAALVDAGRDLPPDLVARYAAAEQVLAPVRAMMGLDRCEVAVSTGAPIDPEVLWFLRALGLPVSEVYGMSEATGPVTWDPRHPRIGDVGLALPGAQLAIAGDGEVLVRGPMVFPGYLDDPAETAAVLQPDGWLHTGDVGAMEDGRLRILGRTKDLLVTATGENVAPASLESRLRGHPLVSEAFVAGDRRPYLVGLVTLDAEAAADFVAAHAAAADVPPADVPPAEVPAVRAELERWVSVVNEDRPRAEQIKRFAILDGVWVPDSDELTPTMKLRRSAVLAKYAARIEELYATARAQP